LPASLPRAAFEAALAEARNGHRSFTMIDDAQCSKRVLPRISRIRFERKIRRWRAVLRREAGERENFFVAKIRDSESVQRLLERRCRSSMTSIEQ
jgi:hypothetical protein